MPRNAPDLFFADLVRDYLADAASVTAGVPDDDTVPKSVLDAGEVQKIPALVVTAEEAGQGTSYHRIIQVVCGLLLQNRATGSDAAADAASLAYSTPRDTAAQYLDAIESRLLDLSALSTYLGTLSESVRDGFVILKARRLPQPRLKREDNKPDRLTLLCAVEFHILWPRSD